MVQKTLLWSIQWRFKSSIQIYNYVDLSPYNINDNDVAFYTFLLFTPFIFHIPFDIHCVVGLSLTLSEEDACENYNVYIQFKDQYDTNLHYQERGLKITLSG